MACTGITLLLPLISCGYGAVYSLRSLPTFQRSVLTTTWCRRVRQATNQFEESVKQQVELSSCDCLLDLAFDPHFSEKYTACNIWVKGKASNQREAARKTCVLMLIFWLIL
jgi:hypothetical protein